MTRTRLAIAVLLFASAALGHAQQAKPLVSPDVLPDGRVTFRLNAPKADEVSLTGEFLDGPRNVAKDADGVWSVTVGPIAPDCRQHHAHVLRDRGCSHVDGLAPIST